MPPARMRDVRSKGISMIFQEPMTALNPVMTIGRQIEEVLKVHTEAPRAERLRQMTNMLGAVSLPGSAKMLRSYPHQLSGGQRQRAMIAMALILKPSVLIADEPTTALDVTTQAQILALIKDTQAKRRMGVLFITHDFGVVAEIADRVAVMQHGKLVEFGETDRILNDPQHPYTRGLIAAVPGLIPKARTPVDEGAPAILATVNLDKAYRSGGGWFGRGSRVVHAARAVNLQVRRGETLGIVGRGQAQEIDRGARCILLVWSVRCRRDTARQGRPAFADAQAATAVHRGHPDGVRILRLARPPLHGRQADLRGSDGSRGGSEQGPGSHTGASNLSGWIGASSIATRTNFRADSASGSGSRGHWRCDLRCLSQTNRCRPWADIVRPGAGPAAPVRYSRPIQPRHAVHHPRSQGCRPGLRPDRGNAVGRNRGDRSDGRGFCRAPPSLYAGTSERRAGSILGKPAHGNPDPEQRMTSRTLPAGGVTASSAAAAMVGAHILAKGGNAVDAAVAAALASCVADPGNTGIGGYGGHMIVAPAGVEPVCVDFNMWLPAYWPPTSYRRRTYPNYRPLVTAVPNVIAGLALALERFGSMRWSEVVEPAIGLAASGVEANGTTSRAFKEVEGADFVEECFAFDPPDGADPERRFRFRQPALAATLKLSRHGPAWFYEGPIGRAACEVFAQAGSPITRREWADAPRAATVAPASKLEYAAGTVFSAPLETSGSPSMFATVAAGAALARANDLGPRGDPVLGAGPRRHLDLSLQHSERQRLQRDDPCRLDGSGSALQTGRKSRKAAAIPVISTHATGAGRSWLSR